MVRLNGTRVHAPRSACSTRSTRAVPIGAPAQLNRAEALLKLGNDDDARQALQRVADTDAAHAGSALLRLGQLQERDGDEAAAEATTCDGQAAPDRAAEALFHVGFTRYRARRSRRVRWRPGRPGLASGPPAPTLQAQLLYWIGQGCRSARRRRRTRSTRPPPPRPRATTACAPRSSSAARCSVASSAAATSSTAWLQLERREVQERDAWLAGLKTDARTRRRRTSTRLPALQRADALLELGLRTEAGWEVDGVAAAVRARPRTSRT